MVVILHKFWSNRFNVCIVSFQLSCRELPCFRIRVRANFDLRPAAEFVLHSPGPRTCSSEGAAGMFQGFGNMQAVGLQKVCSVVWRGTDS